MEAQAVRAAGSPAAAAIQASGSQVKTAETMGKDQFLKLLIAQLKNQNPLSPVEDNDFIAQMAQFSSLEQMTQIKQQLQKVSASNRVMEAYALLGKFVRAIDGKSGDVVTGVVKEVRFGSEFPELRMGDRFVGMDSVAGIMQAGE